jgi:hypothetical protein
VGGLFELFGALGHSLGHVCHVGRLAVLCNRD